MNLSEQAAVLDFGGRGEKGIDGFHKGQHCGGGEGIHAILRGEN